MNQQYLFYNAYYENGGKSYEAANGKLTTNVSYEHSGNIIPLTEQSFVLKTLYPGLLTGVGYSHEWGEQGSDKENEIKLGFSFDYVTGLPYIPGSSVKGILKSAFSKYSVDLATMLGCGENDVNEIKNEVFGDNDNSGKDVFLDAYPIEPDRNKHVLGLDYITSHRATGLGPEYDGLTNPNPVRMLKIMPGVKILFRFILGDTVANDLSLKKEVKLRLFELILQKYGAGAKTNVGYGRFKEAERIDKYHYLTYCYSDPAPNKRERDHFEHRNAPSQRVMATERQSSYTVGQKYSGVIEGHNKKGNFALVRLDDGGKASFWDDGKSNENQKVTLIYKGKKKKDGKEFDHWSKV